MTLNEYREQFDGAPLFFDEFAEGAAKVADDEALQQAAVKYLAARGLFEAQLYRVSVEIG